MKRNLIVLQCGKASDIKQYIPVYKLIEYDTLKIINNVSCDKLADKRFIFGFGTKDGYSSKEFNKKIKKSFENKGCKNFTIEIMKIDNAKHRVKKETSKDILEKYFKLIFN